MRLLYGKPVADRIHAEIKERVVRLSVRPGLAVVLVGNDPASHLYVNLKEKAALADGLSFEKHVFSETDTEEAIVHCIEALNQNDAIHGVIVQLPLPAGFDTDRIIGTLDRKKDADGFHQENIERFLQGEKDQIPVFPEALLELLRSSGEELFGKQAVIVANSEYFGKVMQQACLDANLRASIVLFSALEREKETLRAAEVILSAVGEPGSIDSRYIKPGALLIDGGIAKKDGRIVGDVEATAGALLASFLSPVPGGVGPVTIACLLRKVVALAEKNSGTVRH